MVATRARRHGVGTRLVEIAVEQARAAGCEWLHVDFDDHLHIAAYEFLGGGAHCGAGDVAGRDPAQPAPL